MNLSRPVRVVAATSLVATAVLSAVAVLLEPEFPAEATDRLASMAEGGTSVAISAVAFTLSQLPFLVGVVLIALYSFAASPKLAVAGGILASLGGFGHAVFGGIALSQLAMADSPETAAMGEVVEAIESGPAIPFMAMGLLGTVLGVLLLGVALFRSRLVPRWIPVALWGFLVVEFVGTSLSDWASPAAVALYLAACGGLAAQLMTPARHTVASDTSRSMSGA